MIDDKEIFINNILTLLKLDGKVIAGIEISISSDKVITIEYNEFIDGVIKRVKGVF